MKFIILSGRAGAGKSVCLNLLEDQGFYCIDNLPLGLLSALLENIHPKHSQLAVSIDARNFSFNFEEFHQSLMGIKKIALDCQILYLDADDDILLNRFSETRRKHPLTSSETSLREALIQEALLLQPLANLADRSIDTSYLSVPQLRELVSSYVAASKKFESSFLIESFGYKSGLPRNTDFVFDARLIPNPYWEKHLRVLTGRDLPVIEFLRSQSITDLYLLDIYQFLEKWIPYFQLNQRMYLTIAIGCTGGQHRSVYLVEQLAMLLRPLYPHLQIRHRNLVHETG